MGTERIDKYEIVETVGSGGMAVVYRGRDTVLHREVAVKVLHAHLAGKEGARKRFLREARAVARLHHPCIIEIYDYSGEDAPKNFIVTEFVRGRNLREFAADHALASPEIAALFCHQLAAALEHAHLNGVVHRDIKPDNVMVSESCEVKLADFGIAHVLEAENLTVTGAIVGSPAHMSPEQIEGKSSDARSDIFSLGTILYLLATGRAAFSGDTPAALFRNIIEGRYEDPRAVNPAVDNRLARVIERMIAPDPATRYPDMGEVRRDLCAWLGDIELSDPAREIGAFLAAPDRYLGEIRDRLVPVLRRRAREEMRAGDTAAAMNYCNRVLAAAPEDPETLGIIASAGRRRRAAKAAAALLIVILVAAGAFAARSLIVGAGADVAPSPTVAAPAAPPQPVQAAASPAESEGGGDLRPPAAAEAVKTSGEVRKGVMKGLGQRIALSQKKPAEPRQVKIFVKPYADIYSDGKLLATDARHHVAALDPGPHRLEFRNKFFEPQEAAIEVPETDAVRDVRVELSRVRPAFLKVTSAPAADLWVDDVYKGSSAMTAKEPVVVPMAKDKGARTVRLRVAKQGFRSHEESVELQPGATREIRVTLAPEGN